MKRFVIILLFTLSLKGYAQVSTSSANTGSGGFPIDILFSPMTYSETETSATSISTFNGSGLAARAGVSLGAIDLLGNFKASTQENDLITNGISQSKADTEIGALIRIHIGSSVYLGAGYSLMNSTLTNSGTDTTITKLSGNKMYGLLGYKIKLFGSFKLVIEGTYTLSGEYSSADGIELPSPIILTGLAASSGLSFSF